MVNGPSIVGGQWSKDMKKFFKAILFRPKKGRGREGGKCWMKIIAQIIRATN